MTLRLDESLEVIWHGLGGVWLVVALLILAYAAFGPILRGFGISVLLLFGAQSWYTPAFVLGRNA